MSDKKYMENLCFRLVKIEGLTLEETAKETGLTVENVQKRLESYSERRYSISSGSILTSSGNSGGAINIKLPQNNLEFHTTMPTQSIKIEDIYEIGSDSPLIPKPEIDIDLKNTIQDEDDYFTLPDGRDDSLYLYKNADRQREKIQKHIEQKHKGKNIKVLYMADLHIPFTVYDLVKHIVTEHRDADILVLNGDILDLFAVSTFAKDKSVALKRELEEGRQFLELMSKMFEDVIVVEGNHERRLRNYIKNVIPVDIQFLFPQDVLQVVQSGTVLDLKPLDNVHVVGSWWIQLFDTIFAHPDNYSSVTMRTVMQTSEHFLMVKNIAHRAVIIGHTHQAGKLIDRGRLLMETGCLNYDMDYKNGSKFGKTTWTRAHAVAYFEGGEIDFNRSNYVSFSI